MIVSPFKILSIALAESLALWRHDCKDPGFAQILCPLFQLKALSRETPGYLEIIGREVEVLHRAQHVRLQILKANRPIRALDPGYAREVCRGHGSAEPAPVIRAAAQESEPAHIQVVIRPPERLALVECLGPVIQDLRAAFEQQHPSSSVGECPGESDARRTASGYAYIGLDNLRTVLIRVDENFRHVGQSLISSRTCASRVRRMHRTPYQPDFRIRYGESGNHVDSAFREVGFDHPADGLVRAPMQCGLVDGQ